MHLVQRRCAWRSGLRNRNTRKRTKVATTVARGLWTTSNQLWAGIVAQRRVLPLLAFAVSLGFLNAPGIKPNMSWRSHGKNNEDLVHQLKNNGLIQSNEVEKAMLAVDRGDYVPKGASAYADTPLPIGHNATISAPQYVSDGSEIDGKTHTSEGARIETDAIERRIERNCSMHATCLELLKDSLFPGARVLDVGSGSGYLVAVMAEMVGKEGQVTGIEHIPELTEQSKVVLDRKKAPHWPPIKVLCGDGRLGYPPNAPYDAIHVGAASPEVPDSLIEQLNPGGRIVIPVGSDYQGLMLVEKDENGKVHERNTMGVMYVPLTDKAKQLSRW